jgi:hypothetical protein
VDFLENRRKQRKGSWTAVLSNEKFVNFPGKLILRLELRYCSFVDGNLFLGTVAVLVKAA